MLSKCPIDSYEEEMCNDDDDDDDDSGDESDEESDEDGTIDNAEPLDPEEIMQCLCYKHIQLILLRNPEGERDVLAVEIDLRFTKGHKRKSKR